MKLSLYEVSGKNPSTKRKKKNKVVVMNGASSDEIAEKSGLSDVDSIVYVEQDSAPSSEQIAYASHLGISLPAGCSWMHLHHLLSVRTGEDNNVPVPKWLYMACIEENVWVSEYSGAMEAANYYYHALAKRDKIAFFAFSIYVYITGCADRNMRLNEKYCAFLEFADANISDSDFLASFEKYNGWDLFLDSSSRKRSKAYSRVAAFFGYGK